MPKIRDMLEHRSAIAAEMRQINDTPAGDNGDLSDAQEKRFGELKTELDALEKRIERQQSLDAIERRAAGTSAEAGDPLAVEMRHYSLTRALAASAGLDVDAGREREVSQELARRENRTANGLLIPLAALAPETRAVTAGGTGGNLVAVDHQEQAIDRLRAALITSRLGVQMMGGLRGNVEIPRLATSSATGWVAENSPIGESDPTFDAVTMTPRHVASLTSYSRNLLLQSSPQIEALMRNDLAAQIAEAIDRAVLDGGATANEPTGLTRQVGVTAIDTAGSGVIVEDDILGLLAALEADNAVATGFAVGTGAAAALRALRDADGKVLGTLKGVGASATMLELPAGVTSLMPAFATGATAVIAGNFSDVLVGAWGAVEVTSNPFGDQYFSRASVGVRAIATVDVAIRRPKSFKKLTVKA